MDAKALLAELEKLGTAQNRKVYARHGVTAPTFGVSYAELGKLVKRIQVDDALAEALWKSGNHDARVLATKIADPGRSTARRLDQWVGDVDNYVLGDAVSAHAALSPAAEGRMEKWMKAKGEWIGMVGWNLLAILAGDAQRTSENQLEGRLRTIEAEIHERPNRVRHAMNLALITIGLRSPALRTKALAAAKRIGTVEVDHGETGCKTPDAAAYIQKTLDHRKARAAKKKPAKQKATSARGRSVAR